MSDRVRHHSSDRVLTVLWKDTMVSLSALPSAADHQSLRWTEGEIVQGAMFGVPVRQLRDPELL